MEQVSKHEIIQIDIEKVIRNKNPKLLKWLPGFVLNYLKRVLHQEEVNYALRTYGDKTGYEFVDEILKYFNINIVIKGEENIPRDGKYIFAANHPLGGIEGMALISVVHRYHEVIRFVVNDILLNLKNFDPILVPVNKHGSYTKDYAKILENTFNSEAQVMYFPAGLVSRRINGKVVDLEWKKSFISKAVQYQRDIIPVFIEGRNSSFFYNLASFRKAIGINANIEMFYLADEMFKQKNKTLTMHFGKAVSYKTFDASKTQLQWAAYIKQQAYLLSEK
jgi:1-acyl-sn-glycerol-3-phosphate acyltransferase